MTRKIEHMDDNLMSRLRQLGVVKGARNLRQVDEARRSPNRIESRHPESSEFFALESLIPGGYLFENQFGACFVVDRLFPVNYRHGSDRLADLLELAPAVGARYTRDDRLNGLDFHDFVFLDTETTGLAGAGSLAFMVGVAFFDQRAPVDRENQTSDGAFVVRQFFLRDQGDEPAMLQELNELVSGKAGLITFNGRTFDVPLLGNRYLMNRMPERLADLPHIDLLPPSRRLWRARLGSCALGSLETNLLGLGRTEEDIPGWLIPSIYHNYLRTGDGREISRVFYHNRMDILSMVTLATRVFRHFQHPEAGEALDLLSLGRWQADMGLAEDAERSLKSAMDGDLAIEAYHQAAHRLALLYKQAGRRDEAIVLWQQIAYTSTDDVLAHVELAKHFEWHEDDPANAQKWTLAALDLTERWLPSIRTQYTQAELRHRLDRLERKLAASAS